MQIGIYGFDDGQVLPCPIPHEAKCLFKDNAVAYYIYRNLRIIEYREFDRIISNVKKEKAVPGMKVQLYLDKFYPDKMMSKTNLRYMIFPNWSPDSKSSLELMPEGEVLKELLPSTMMCFDPEISKSHFEFNCMLAERAPAARLIMGYDRESWHKLVTDFICNVRKWQNG